VTAVMIPVVTLALVVLTKAIRTPRYVFYRELPRRYSGLVYI
jgi:hypothetical protein